MTAGGASGGTVNDMTDESPDGLTYVPDLDACSVIICTAPSTHVGSLATPGGEHSLPVAYCDEHTESQQNIIGEQSRLVLTLTPRAGA